MKTLIKWPGGKSREYVHIKDLIPKDIDTYIEPFFGGGAIYFKLKPEKSIINDINKNLMTFYQLLKENNYEFKKTLTQIENDWENLSIIAKNVFDNVRRYKKDINKIAIQDTISKLSKDKTLPKLINGQEKYWKILTVGLIDKLQRIVSLEIKNGEFEENDFYSQIEAVAKGAYYYYLRDQFNPKNEEEQISKFYFLREYCFGSMFRFNRQGKFNIPYGGASYNNKKINSKINYAFSDKVNSMLQNTEIYSEDFQDFFDKVKYKLTNKDFCFFDPPYDTEFSEYDKEPFGIKEQAQLASLFGNLKCRALMIIKKTDYINQLYNGHRNKNANISIREYTKNYTYNVRGRNERGVTHLLVLNYEPRGVKRVDQLTFGEPFSTAQHV